VKINPFTVAGWIEFILQIAWTHFSAGRGMLPRSKCFELVELSHLAQLPAKR